MRDISRLLALTALLAGAIPAHADQAIAPTRPVAVLSPIEFADQATAMPWIKSDCNLQQAVERDIGEILHHDGVGGDPTNSLASGYVLKVVIERAYGQKGGGWSGTKALSLGLQLFADGVPQRSTEVNAEAKSWNMFAGSCTSLQKASRQVSLRVSAWLRNREFAKGDAPLAGASAASAPSH